MQIQSLSEGTSQCCNPSSGTWKSVAEGDWSFWLRKVRTTFSFKRWSSYYGDWPWGWSRDGMNMVWSSVSYWQLPFLEISVWWFECDFIMFHYFCAIHPYSLQWRMFWDAWLNHQMARTVWRRWSALDIFEKMENRDGITFTSLVTALSNGRLNCSWTCHERCTWFAQSLPMLKIHWRCLKHAFGRLRCPPRCDIVHAGHIFYYVYMFCMQRVLSWWSRFVWPNSCKVVVQFLQNGLAE